MTVSCNVCSGHGGVPDGDYLDPELWEAFNTYAKAVHDLVAGVNGDPWELLITRNKAQMDLEAKICATGYGKK